MFEGTCRNWGLGFRKYGGGCKKLRVISGDLMIRAFFYTEVHQADPHFGKRPSASFFLGFTARWIDKSRVRDDGVLEIRG